MDYWYLVAGKEGFKPFIFGLEQAILRFSVVLILLCYGIAGTDPTSPGTWCLGPPDHLGRYDDLWAEDEEEDGVDMWVVSHPLRWRTGGGLEWQDEREETLVSPGQTCHSGPDLIR